MTKDFVSTKPKPFVFVLMPFADTFADIYKFGIKGAAEDAGAYAERIDEQIFNEGMLDRIFNQINKSDVIVADMTGRNPNVFYEVGYAHALNKLVLLITQSVNDIPFDLKHHKHIIYGNSIDHLRTELGRSIKWAVSESERRTPDNHFRQISLRYGSKNIPDGLSVLTPFAIAGAIKGDWCQLPLILRNEAERDILEISHTYLFGTDDSQALPIGDPWTTGFVNLPAQQISGIPQNVLASTSAFHTPQYVGPAPNLTGPSPLDFYTADPSDAPDGLTRQYRLPVVFSSMPPHTVEGMILNFRLTEPTCDSKFRVRFHTMTRYFDFCFQLSVSNTEAK